LNIDRDKLYERIDFRVDKMIEQGLVDEAAGLFQHKSLKALQTVGYKEVFDYMDNKYTLPEAINKIKQHSRNYAKRQITWFKKDKSYLCFQPDEFERMIRFIEK
jgi:tRNA dimethylallyltransferase